MPPAGKATKKKVQQSKSSTSVEATPESVHDVTVRDCLMWPGDDRTLPAEDHSDMVYVSLRQQQQQQSDVPPPQMCRAPAVIEDDATVGDALRGWPRHAKQLEPQAANDDDDDRRKQQAPTKTKTSQAAAKGAKSKSKTSVTKEQEDDIHVADLISQRFLHEYMEQRETEMERERKKKEAREIAAREGRRAAKDRTDIKAKYRHRTDSSDIIIIIVVVGFNVA